MRVVLSVTLCLFFFSSIASAENVQGIEIEFVTIGNPGNPGDTTGFGAVGYEYSIGKYEVTNAQWVQFTTAAGAPTGNPSSAYDHSAYYTSAQQPTTGVSWYEGLQFCNYLTSGDKSQGAYLFSGDNTNPGDFLSIDRNSAISIYGTVYVIPTEDEWYKAAYYTGADYSTYANGNIAPTPGINTNYYNVNSEPWDVGVGNGTQEQNGTFDMMGNVWEWNETIIFGSYRGIRGGGFATEDFGLASSVRYEDGNPDREWDAVGFRVACIPEPASALFLLAGIGMFRGRKFRV